MKDGQHLPIRNNEAKLLAFFLANPEQVFSKDAILENVWAGKVVSEQAVFQAISNLRTLFGDEAIKTFPKKGYQWQLSLQVAPLPLASTINYFQTSATRKTWGYKFWPVVLVALTCLSLAFYFNLSNTDVADAHQSIRVIVEPFVLDVNNTGAEDLPQVVQAALSKRIYQHPSIVLLEPPSNHFSYQVAAAPAHFFNLYNQSVNANLLVTGRVGQAGDKWVLSFVLQGHGHHNQWRGYLTAASATGLATELDILLSKVAPLKILWESQDLRLLNAQLQLLHSENPDNLPILYQLVDNSLYLGDMDKAHLRAVELAQQAISVGDIRYQVLALSAQALASLDMGNTDQFIAIVDKSAALAAEANDPLLQSQVMEHYTYIYYQLKNFELIEKKLLEALELAETAQAPEQQAQVLRLLSIFSYKFNRADKQNVYLMRAQAILDQYQFPDESYALLDDIVGMFSDDKAEQEQFFWRALNRFTSEQEAWIKERAQEHLVDFYIREQRWQDAFSVFGNETRFSGAELFYGAKIHFAQKNFAMARAQAETAFKQALISGEYYAALDAALLLAQLHNQFNQAELQKSYVEYIDKNAPPFWKNNKKEILLTLNAD